MKRLVFCFALAGIFIAAPASATEVGNSRRFGLGFGIGEPTGIVAKGFLNNQNAIDAGVAFRSWWGRCYARDQWERCDGRTHLSFNLDYLWQMNLVRSTVKLDWHIGVGGRMWFFSSDSRYNDLALAARMPLGLDLTFQNPSFLEVFFELSPALYLVPGTDFDIEPVIGVRFYF